ncbi:MAG: two component transcriptional regulator, Fis family [Anaeromyxobacteraceae bacterium]|nr:two component transcriptional regulator, Fis family [Anaeromyxobacteraceae bacterium]
MSQEAGKDAALTLLLVDDDEVLRERLGRALRERGFEVTTAESGEAAIAVARRDAPEFAVVDLRMPGISGIEVLDALRAIDPATRVLMLTGYGSIATAVEATRRGAVGYLSKPADADEVVAARPVRAATTSSASAGLDR